jgi:hypothetical protein
MKCPKKRPTQAEELRATALKAIQGKNARKLSEDIKRWKDYIDEIDDGLKRSAENGEYSYTCEEKPMTDDCYTFLSNYYYAHGFDVSRTVNMGADIRFNAIRIIFEEYTNDRR